MNDIVQALIEHAAEFTLVDPVLSAVRGGAVSLAKDWIGPQRLSSISEVFARAKKKLGQRKDKPIEPPLSVLLPLLEAAQDEGRAELLDIWASLLAAAADPARMGIFRRDFIDIAKQLEPIDALTLRFIAGISGDFASGRQEAAVERLRVSGDQIAISFQKLRDLKLISSHPPNQHHPQLEALGRLFMLALAD